MAAQERKYQVFISSTFRDLQEARNQAHRGVLDARHMPIGLEYFSPQAKSDLEVIKREIQGSQVYILILGWRYGEIPHGNTRSYTELEYATARDAKCQILIWVLDWRDVERQRRRLKDSDPGDRREIRNRGKLERFRREIRKGTRFYKEWSLGSPEEIRVGVVKSLKDIATEQGAPRGFVREGDATHEFFDLYASSAIVRDLLKQMRQFAELNEKLNIETGKKESLAEAFVALHGDDVQRKYRQVFFESGSTVASLARALAEPLLVGTPEVRTNNAFAHMYLWLCRRVFSVAAPPGPPDEKYGGTYGELTGRERAPDYRCPGLGRFDRRAQEIVEEMAERVIFSKATEADLVFAAASGLQVSGEITALRRDGGGRLVKCGDRRITRHLEERCRGFHVGSYYNKLFKRCLYATNRPTIVFIHDEKIDCPIEVGKCHFVCDEEYLWARMLKEYPLSLWVVCDRRTYEGRLALLRRTIRTGEWAFGTYGEANEHPVLIGHNARFREAAKQIGVMPWME